MRSPERAPFPTGHERAPASGLSAPAALAPVAPLALAPPALAPPTLAPLATVAPPSVLAALASLAALAVLAVLSGCASTPAPVDAAGLIARAEATLGSSAMTTLTYRGRGTRVAVGQAYKPDAPPQVLQMRAHSRAMHFDERAYREEFIRSPAAATPAEAGAASPQAGETRGVVLARQAFSWDVVGVAVAPAQTSWVSRMHDLWLSTPQGALKAASRHGATAGRHWAGLRRMDTLSFTVPGQFSATLLLERDGRVARIDSVLPDPLRGDIAVRTDFIDYRQRGKLLFPQQIMQHQDGVRVLDVQVGSVVLDANVEITVPENVRTSGNAPAVELLADRVWLLAGGTHHSVLIEQATQLVLVEAPLDDERGRALLGAARRLADAKPLGVVVSTQHHLDHVGGLRVMAAEGATLLIGAPAKSWLEASFRRPLTQRPDPLGERAEPPRVQAVAERWVFDDAERPVEVHVVRDSPHAAGMLMVWLPQQQLLIQADAWTPGPSGADPPPQPEPDLVNLLDNLQRLGIKPLRVVSLHGRVMPAAEMYRQAARPAPP